MGSFNRVLYRNNNNCFRCSSVTCLLLLNTSTVVSPGNINWVPCIDYDIVRGPPLLLAKQGKLNKVPILHGFNFDEGNLFAAIFAPNPTGTWEFK